jgi:hypothetical protein
MGLQNESQGFRDKQFCLQEGFCDIAGFKFTDIDETGSMSFENADRP